jgi:FAD binding domain-containing protein
MIFTPTTYEEVQECFRKSGSLSVHSSRQEDSASSDILSLERFNSVLLYEPQEMIVRVQAGILLEDLTNHLRDEGQWIPTLVAGENSESTLGAAIANDSYHPRAATLGMLRTAILGGTFAAADGTLFKSGSRVVKSVAGYDIHRAFCGTKGKFGAILDVTLKVQPLPEGFFWFETATERLPEIMYFYPTIVETDNASTFFELAGFREDIEYDGAELTKVGITIMTDQEAHNKIREIIDKKIVAAVSAEDLSFEHVRKAFDPKGVLQ